jgi:hypothetical protein
MLIYPKCSLKTFNGFITKKISKVKIEVAVLKKNSKDQLSCKDKNIF